MDRINLRNPRSGRQVRPSARPAGRRGGDRRGGFSLIELVIVVVIIGIIAAIAIPRMSRGSAGAADSALSQNLAILRNAVDLYQSEHQGLFPTGTSAQVSDQLLKYSDINGNVSATKDTTNGYIYGPYLRAVPVMTVGSTKGKNGIAVSTDAATAPTGGTSDGWLFNAATGSMAPNVVGVTNDSAGKLYSSY